MVMRTTLILLPLIACGEQGDAGPSTSPTGDTATVCAGGMSPPFVGIETPVCEGDVWTVAWEMQGEVDRVVLNIFDLAAPTVEQHAFADDIAMDEECGTAALDQSKDLTAEGNLGAGGTRLPCDRAGDPQVVFVLRQLSDTPELRDCVLFGWDSQQGLDLLDNPNLTSGIPDWTETADQCRWLDPPKEP